MMRSVNNNKAECEPLQSKMTQQQQSSASKGKKSPKDFKFGRLIGEGSFSTVYLAKEVHTGKEYAIKVCEKLLLRKEEKEHTAIEERNVMNMLNSHPSPFFIKFYCCFQDTDKLYFVMSYAKCGDLLSYLKKVGSFDEQCTRFYTGELVLALEHLHRLGIVHRDLKPENILLTESMHIQVTDFGSACILSEGSSEEQDIAKGSAHRRHRGLAGTAQYVSPEYLGQKITSVTNDLWALGCIIYHMVSGRYPFSGDNDYAIFKVIMAGRYEFPSGFLPTTQDLVEKLLVVDRNKRLGALDSGGYPSIKSHKFFHGLDWETLHLQTPPKILPYLPGIAGGEDFRSQYEVPDDVEPGLDDKQMSRLLGLALQEDYKDTNKEAKHSSILDISPKEYSRLIKIQSETNQWHQFVENNLILKQGLVDKRKGLFARRRMLLLTTGPHLYYVDPHALVLKGEIPWSSELRTEVKNFRTFFVHTPGRTYYLEDLESRAPEWCKMIDEVRKATYGSHH